MIVVGIPVAPWVRKTLLFLDEKGLDYELIPSHPGGFPGAAPKLLEWSPMGKIPALVHDDVRFSDSTAICFYVDALHPESALIPSDPQALGESIALDQFINEQLGPNLAYRFFFPKVILPMVLGVEPNMALAEDTEVNRMPKLLGMVDDRLDGREWLAGEFGFADISLFGHIAQLVMVKKDLSPWPHLAAWCQRMLQRPAVGELLRREQEFAAKGWRSEAWEALSASERESYLLKNISANYAEALGHFAARHPDLSD